MIRNFVRSTLALALVLAMAVPALAHFGMAIPPIPPQP